MCVHYDRNVISDNATNNDTAVEVMADKFDFFAPYR